MKHANELVSGQSNPWVLVISFEINSSLPENPFSFGGLLQIVTYLNVVCL